MNLKTILENQAWDDDFYAAMIENVKAMAPPLAGATVETGVEP